MTTRRVVVLATGTGVGKTHVTSALLMRWLACGRAAVALKPVESGSPTDGSAEEGDHIVLARAAAFHVKQHDAARLGAGPAGGPVRPLYQFPEPVSPHLAARAAGITIAAAAICAWVAHRATEVTLIETAGGAFSPLAPGLTNLELVAQLLPAYLLLVAPDRLGVLHDVTAAVRLAAHLRQPFDGVVLSAPAHPDQSTGTNARELALLGIANPIATFPRADLGDPRTRHAAEVTAQAIERTPER